MIERTGTLGSLDDLNDDPRFPIFKVPMFYSIKLDSKLGYLQMLCASFAIATLFGAIHCVGWSSKILFSSEATSILWRISSMTITLSPLVWSLLSFSIYANDTSTRSSFSHTIYEMLEQIFLILSFPTIPLYIISRIILIALVWCAVCTKNRPDNTLTPHAG